MHHIHELPAHDDTLTYHLRTTPAPYSAYNNNKCGNNLVAKGERKKQPKINAIFIIHFFSQLRLDYSKPTVITHYC